MHTHKSISLDRVVCLYEVEALRRSLSKNPAIQTEWTDHLNLISLFAVDIQRGPNPNRGSLIWQVCAAPAKVTSLAKPYTKSEWYRHVIACAVTRLLLALLIASGTYRTALGSYSRSMPRLLAGVTTGPP